jgi:hypothetical protein
MRAFIAPSSSSFSLSSQDATKALAVSSSSSSSCSRRVRAPSPLGFKKATTTQKRKRILEIRAGKTEDGSSNANKISNTNKKNFINIQPKKPYNDTDNKRPWYIDENGKANGIVVIVVFLLSQVFIGTVLQPLAVFINQLWEPIVGGNLYVDNIY